MGVFQGGRADGNGGDGRETKRRVAALPKVRLDTAETALAHKLLSLGRHAFQLVRLCNGKAPGISQSSANSMAQAKNGYRQTYGFKILTSSEVEYNADLSRHPTSLEEIEGISQLEKHTDSNYRTIHLTPTKLLAFLESAPVAALLNKIRAHEKTLPVCTDNRGHEDRLAGLSADIRANLVDLQSALRDLSKEITVEARRGKFSHPLIAAYTADDGLGPL